MSTKITDLVDQSAIDQVKSLNEEIKKLLDTYTNTAREISKGLEINVKVVGDIDKLQNLLIEKTKEAVAVNEQLASAVARRGQVIANTTPTLSRELMEMERLNKSQREAYTDGTKVKAILEDVTESYENNARALAKLDLQIKSNKKSQQDLEKQYKNGLISQDAYIEAQAKLLAIGRDLAVQKSSLTQVMKIEEKMNNENETSYAHCSQQLELLKKTYKELTETQRESEAGLAMVKAIQDLDAHLKDTAADMGEFQRSVGNYAIAGRNGVVTTESVTAALNQEARTTQDLVDQTRILEEAKRLLNTNDANYQSTLDKVNAKLDENKRKLSDVSDIMGKDAKSVAEAEMMIKRYEAALKMVDITAPGAKEKIKALNDEIDKHKKLIRDVTGDNEDFANSILGLIGININLGSSLQSLSQNGNFIDGLNTKVKAFGKTLSGILANPWVLAFLGITGIVAGFKWWYDFNKGLIEASHLTENFTGVTGEAADAVTADMKTLADKMEKGYSETIGAANVMVQQFGLSWEEAYEKMKDGIVAGADMSGNMLSNIERFAPALRDAGVSADQFMAILAQTRNGIFDERGLQDILKGGTRLRSMTKAVAESLDACGISSKKMQQDLADGTITMLDAVKKVSKKLQELPENSQEAGRLMKDVFGRTAAEGGRLLLESLADVKLNLEEQKKSMGELGKLNEEQMNTQRELNEALMAVFKMSDTAFQEMIIKAKTFIMQGLINIIRRCADIVNWFVDMYNESETFRKVIAIIVGVFETLWTIVKAVVDLLINGFRSTGQALEGVMLILSGEFEAGLDKIGKAVMSHFDNLGKIAKQRGKEIADNFVDNYKSSLDRKLDNVSIDLKHKDKDKDKDKDKKDSAANADRNRTGAYPGFKDKEGEKEAKKQAKEAEKAAKEELKRLHELEEAKIAVMADGHEKEMAMIRLNFKKKIYNIKGEGETQTALRLQLVEQMMKELADCEQKYQLELSKINTANALARAEKGSKQELDLKLAQLEMSRAAELKEAQKTGADVALINEKFEKQRLEMYNEYASKRADKIMEEYGIEEILRNREYTDAVNALKDRYAKEFALTSGNAAKQEELKDKLDAELFKLDTEYSQKTAQNSIEMIEKILKVENLSAKDRLKWENELAKAKIELSKQVADANAESVERQIAADEKLREKRKANLEKWLDVASDAIGGISELVSTLYDGEIDKIETLQEKNEEAGERQQEHITKLVEQNVITEEEGEARKRSAEELTAKKNEELEKKKAALQYKQAVYQKANDLAQAGISTALAITNALNTKPFMPLGLAMAAIAGTMGAMQMATIVSTPIPKYAKGTDYHAGGPAIVGDGGRPELVMFGDKAWVTPDKPTLVNLPEGASVLPQILPVDLVTHTPELPADISAPRVTVNNDFRKLEKKMDKVIYLFACLQNSRKQTETSNYLELMRLKLK